MKLEIFMQKLAENTNKELVFTYQPNQYVGANYHLTEVKTVVFDTVDCGGTTNSWKETHLQLWESPKEIGKTEYMKAGKILEILQRVNTIKALQLNTEVKVEYGNSNFHTAIQPILNMKLAEDRIVVQLSPDTTQCKADDKCGVPIKLEAEACCTTEGCC